MSVYDVVIVGAGPSGITCAFMMAKMGKKVLLLEKEDGIGGCHRPQYVQSPKTKEWFFTEHGPRLYSRSFVQMFSLLKQMKIDTAQLFTPYHFSNVNSLWHEIHKLQLFEIYQITSATIRARIDSTYGRRLSVLQFCQSKNFTRPSIEFFDGVCRLVDGGDASRMTWYEFLQLVKGRQLLHESLQPTVPNDKGLLYLMHKALVDAGVEIRLHTTISSVDIDNHIVTSCYTHDGKRICTKQQLILAIPPESLVAFLDSTFPQGPFGPMNELRMFAQRHAYNTDISLTLHWNYKISNLPVVWGFPSGSEWGVAWIVMSDYMQFSSSSSKTVISLVITKPDQPCRRLQNMTCHQITNRQTILDEAVKQIQERFLELAGFHLPDPDHSFMSPAVVMRSNGWTVTHKSFLDRPGYKHLPANSPTVSNLYSLGTHNGHSSYKFTSFESAVENAMVLCHELIPHSKKTFPIKKFP